MAETEHRVEKSSCYLLNRETGEVTALDGLRIRWRFKGERRWRNHVVVPDANLGQTCESLRVDMDAIVAALAQNAGPSRG